MSHPDDGADAIEQRDPPIRSPFIEHLGMEFVRLGEDEVEVRLPIRAELLNSAAMVHGGVYATLADTALAAAIYSRVQATQMVITVELSCRYLRAASSGVLCAVARAVHVGRRTAVAEGEILVDGVLQVKATGTFVLVPRAELGTAAPRAEA